LYHVDSFEAYIYLSIRPSIYIYIYIYIVFFIGLNYTNDISKKKIPTFINA